MSKETVKDLTKSICAFGMNCTNPNCPRIHRQSTYDFVKIKENYDCDVNQ
jgi:hypothetical protein